eukprot:TRINITY_DN11958_c0_g2_i1.p1 TRINITY_DN11958_c0_g2~~TRINITY_DN11958_c0_g2_i1.p1  ORF type:complete len:531 (+),score=131.83 TRINITY_DN11958_c0_g2_i1:84-1676(+)
MMAPRTGPALQVRQPATTSIPARPQPQGSSRLSGGPGSIARGVSGGSPDRGITSSLPQRRPLQISQTVGGRPVPREPRRVNSPTASSPSIITSLRSPAEANRQSSPLSQREVLSPLASTEVPGGEMPYTDSSRSMPQPSVLPAEVTQRLDFLEKELQRVMATVEQAPPSREAEIRSQVQAIATRQTQFELEMVDQLEVLKGHVQEAAAAAATAAPPPAGPSASPELERLFGEMDRSQKELERQQKEQQVILDGLMQKQQLLVDDLAVMKQQLEGLSAAKGAPMPPSSVPSFEDFSRIASLQQDLAAQHASLQSRQQNLEDGLSKAASEIAKVRNDSLEMHATTMQNQLQALPVYGAPKEQKEVFDQSSHAFHHMRRDLEKEKKARCIRNVQRLPTALNSVAQKLGSLLAEKEANQAGAARQGKKLWTTDKEMVHCGMLKQIVTLRCDLENYYVETTGDNSQGYLEAAQEKLKEVEVRHDRIEAGLSPTSAGSRSSSPTGRVGFRMSGDHSASISPAKGNLEPDFEAAHSR